ncbi:Lrp/AsnC family transcriptional regulator [Eleftheria terrae]|uniref:Lrp/AsnC family transcriptional regulator n=1 Tax=Eleftheria terrae TaxID=1597781 RepID=UPI00263BC40B|nr:Lrp/AsnC ligand binding domain-containing protein [Eleftheria terrae]WKB50704.1 Lrp/AsnC ligand binding domain-containing protein [Eleftheria terrae]
MGRRPRRGGPQRGFPPPRIDQGTRAGRFLLAELDARRLGPSTSFVVAVQVEQERPELLAQFRDWLAAQEPVQEAFYVTGDADFILVVCAPDTATYDAWTARMVSENPNIRRFTTHVALHVVERGLGVPIALDAGA